MIPGEVLALIKGTPGLELSGTPTTEFTCQGAKFHSPRPMVVHEFTTPDKTIYLCGTCVDNVGLLRSLLKAADVPWTVRRCFGNNVRQVAELLSNTEENHA